MGPERPQGRLRERILRQGTKVEGERPVRRPRFRDTGPGFCAIDPYRCPHGRNRHRHADPPVQEERRLKGPIQVAVIAGSKSDQAVVEDASNALTELGVPHEVQFISAHRNPDRLRDYVARSPAKVFIAIAGLSAHLPGVIASLTLKPVIGVPVNVKLAGIDSLLSIVQMPPGVPVGTVGIDNARNAAILAAEILGLTDPAVQEGLKKMREAWK